MSSSSRWVATGIVAAHIAGVVLTCRADAIQPTRAPGNAVGDEEVQASRERGLALNRQAGRNWVKNKTCFSCHHQTLPMLADVEATKAGSRADAAWLKTQADFTLEYLKDHVELMKAGRHLPGGSTTAGFGLWALMLDNRSPDETTETTVAFLLKMQGLARPESSDAGKVEGQAKSPARIDGPWLPSCNRPPLTSSRVGNTVIVLMGLQAYATKNQRPEVEKATARAGEWLSRAPLRDTEDLVWRLWGLELLGGNEETKREVRSALLRTQNKDGGWSQTKDLGSDAYATGQVLYVLLKTGTPRDDAAARRAAAYLVRTQLKDGSWLVKSRVKAKAQQYFDNGDPHGEHQFLSVAATSWATAALSRMSLNDEPGLCGTSWPAATARERSTHTAGKLEQRTIRIGPSVSVPAEMRAIEE